LLSHENITLVPSARFFCALAARGLVRFREVNYVNKRDAIRAFGLYFSEIPEFDCKPVLFPSDPQMNIPKMIA
jgi:hypothetical protein